MMKLILNEKESKIIEQASEITDVDYGEIELEDLFIIIQDLVVEVGKLKEEIEDKEKYCEEFHETKSIDPYDFYGVSERDFH